MEMPTDLSSYVTTIGAAYAGVQLVAQGMLAIQKIFLPAPEHTLWFKFWKFVVAGPTRLPKIN
jgi:hypothetical protein